MSCGISQSSVLSPLPSSYLTSDPLGAFAVWPLAHYLMSLSFLCFMCEMGRLSPASALLEGLSERCGGSTQQSARHGSDPLPAEVQCSSHAAACWSLGFNMSTGARGKASLRGQCPEEAVPAFACPFALGRPCSAQIHPKDIHFQHLLSHLRHGSVEPCV